MTSAAVVEIIDLTDTDPPIDDDTYKIQKSENYKEVADPEKNAARTAHKRKNGEVGAVRSHPVESVGSRDVSVERDHEQSGEGATELQPVEDSQGRNEEPTSTKKRKRRSKKGKDKDKESAPSSREDIQHDALANLDDGQLFFIDTEPASVPTIRAFESNDDGAKGTQSSSQTPKVDKVKVPLLLPAHVSVFAPGDDLPVQIVQPADSDSDAESYIEYLDYDDRLAPDMVRYFEAPTEEQKQARFVCKRCGAESEHRTNECPVLICLTCGARDEHSTRSCPISKTCFTCGMKGHINKDCPNRHSRGMSNKYNDCDRCGSDAHQTNECPTIWRLYEYVTDPEREAILRSRESKQSLGLGKGGEGYIASDEWCYNCGNYGHLGDDCGELPHPHDKPSAPCAFGLYNILSGPFSDAATAATRPRAPRDWENGDTFGDGWGARAPINVGKRARNKDRLRMEQRALELREQEQDRDDSGDWFERARNTRNERSRRRDRDRDRSSSPGASTTGGGRGVRKKKDAKIRIGIGIGMAWKSSDDPPLSPHHHSRHDQHDHHHQPHHHRKPTLLERVSSDNNMNDDDVVEIDVVDFHSRGHPDRFHGREREQEREREDRDRDDRDYSRSRGGRERSRDRDQGSGRGQGRDARGGGGGGLRIRGSANRTRIDGSRREHSGSYEREGRRREEESRGGDRRWEDKRGRDRKYEPRTGRDNNDRIPRGPQYKGGYA